MITNILPGIRTNDRNDFDIICCLGFEVRVMLRQCISFKSGDLFFMPHNVYLHLPHMYQIFFNKVLFYQCTRMNAFIYLEINLLVISGDIQIFQHFSIGITLSLKGLKNIEASRAVKASQDNRPTSRMTVSTRI